MTSKGAHRRLAGRLVIATHNPGKLEEMRELLMPFGIDTVSAGELGLREPAEDGTTFKENARLKAREMVTGEPLRDHVAAISCGICNGTPVLDLDYAEDSEADTDANFVMTGDGRIVEVQGTAEKTPFTEEQFLNLLALAKKGVMKLVDLQKIAVM